jgi:hypothetical protein
VPRQALTAMSAWLWPVRPSLLQTSSRAVDIALSSRGPKTSLSHSPTPRSGEALAAALHAGAPMARLSRLNSVRIRTKSLFVMRSGRRLSVFPEHVNSRGNDSLGGDPPRQELAAGRGELCSGYRLAEKDASWDSAMIVCRISRSIDHRRLRERDSKRSCHVPA